MAKEEKPQQNTELSEAEGMQDATGAMDSTPSTTSDSSSKNTSATVGSIMLLTLLGKAMGLWRDRLLAIHYGTGMEANAFYTASRIPRVFFDGIFASAISLCLIPVFGKLLTLEGEKKAYDFAGNFLSVMGAMTAVISFLGLQFAPSLVELFAVGYDEATKALAIELTQLLLPTVFFTGIAFSFVGILQGRERFLVPALISAVSNGVIILYFYVGNAVYGIFGLAYAYLLGWAMQALVQVPSLRQIGFRYRPNFSPSTPEMKQVFGLMAPVMISTWVQPINFTVSTRYASTLYQGAGVSILEISTNLYLIIAGVFILSVTNVIFPRLAVQSASGEMGDFRETLRETLHLSLFFTLPMSAGIAVVAEPLVSFFYGGGAFGPEEVTLTASALGCITVGMAGYGLQNIISRGFFAKEDGKTPLLAGICSIAVNLILCQMLLDTMGVQGLAIASALSSTLYGVILLFALEKQEGGILTGSFSLDFGKMLLATGGMYVLARLVLSLLWETVAVHALVAMAVTAVVGLLVYGLLTAVLGLQEMNYVKKFLMNLRKKE